MKSYSKERDEGSEEMKGELDPRSEDTCNVIPCLAKACVMKTFATYMAVTVSVVGVNTPSLEKRSIMIRNVAYSSDSGSYSLDESILIKCHGRYRMRRGCVECRKVGGKQACFVR